MSEHRENIMIASNDITKLLEMEIATHEKLEASKGQDFKDGFVAGLKHAKENLVIACEVIALQEAK